MLRDNGSNAHRSYHCCGGTYFPPSTEASGTECGEVSCTSSLESGRLVLPIYQPRTYNILMRLRQSDPILNTGVNVMRPVFNFEPKYRVTTLTREDWTIATGTPPVVKGIVWFTDGSKMKEGIGAGFYGQSMGRRLSFSLGRYATVFQADIYAILTCVYKIQFQSKPEKYVSICSDSQAALQALQAVTSPLVQQS